MFGTCKVRRFNRALLYKKEGDLWIASSTQECKEENIQNLNRTETLINSWTFPAINQIMLDVGFLSFWKATLLKNMTYTWTPMPLSVCEFTLHVGRAHMKLELLLSATFTPTLTFLSCFLAFKNNQGCFPFDEKFRFEFLEISSGEWNSIFRISRKIGQPREVYPNFWKFLTGKFCSIWFSSRNFRFNCSRFGNSTM